VKLDSTRRRAVSAPAALLAILLLAACQTPSSVPVETIEEEAIPAPLESSFGAADPAAAQQLVKGFYAPEQDSWRWTMKDFDIALAPPLGAATMGATLRFHFTVPEPVIDQLGALTLSARAGEIVLDPETYSEPGGYVYERTIPPELLLGDVLTVQFSLDKAIAPTAADQRELGVVFNSVELLPR
jgi:hypothetical protein